MRSSAGILVVLTLAVAGCGGEASSAADFEGEERAVAETVEEMQTAGKRQDAAKMCRDLLTRELRDQIAEGGTSCDKELEKAMQDSESFELEVRDVTVAGTTAQADVRGEDGEKDRTATFHLVKEDGRWRVASFDGTGVF